VVTCGYCRTLVPVPADLRHRAAEHAARVAVAQQKVDAATQAAAQMRLWSDGQGLGLTLVAVVVPVAVVVGLVGNLLAPYLPREVLPVLMPLTVYGTIAAVGASVYVRHRRRGKLRAAPLAVVTATCGQCGGPLTFVAGAAGAHCPACNATGLAGRTIVRDLGAAAERRAEEVELDRFRAERQMYRSMSAATRFGGYYVLAAMGWPVLAIGVVGLAAGVSQLVEGIAAGTGRAVQHGLEAFGIGCLLAAGSAAVGVLVYLIVVRPSLAAGAVLRAIAAQSGGTATQGGTTAALDWLDAFWAAPARPELMVGQGELVRSPLVGRMGGLPVLVVVLSGGSSVRGQRLHVAIAAPHPHPHADASRAPAAAELRRRGFEVQSGAAGISLSHPQASPVVVNEETLAWVLRAGLDLARR
jgi:hypothetical protein